MTGFKGPDLDAGAQIFLQGPIGYLRDAFMSELTSRDNPRFRTAAEVYCPISQKDFALGKRIAERMMGQGKSHFERQKKQMPPEAPSVNLQQEGVQSAKQNGSVMLL